MSLKINSEIFGLKTFEKVLVTGGGSQNPTILQLIADIFNAPVYGTYSLNLKVDKSDFQSQSCVFGSCLRAYHGTQCTEKFLKIETLLEGKNYTNFQKITDPKNPQNYLQLIEDYRKLE